MTQQAKESTSKIVGVATVEPNRIELMVEEAVEYECRLLEVVSVDVRLDQERESLQTVARGRACVHARFNDNFSRFEGTFQVTGYRSSKPDTLEVSLDLSEEDIRRDYEVDATIHTRAPGPPIFESYCTFAASKEEALANVKERLGSWLNADHLSFEFDVREAV